MKDKSKKPAADKPTWTFLSNHGHVLLCLAKDPEVRLREIAILVGITERAVHRIVQELEESAYIKKSRIGRRNRYSVNSNKPLRHPIEAHHSIKALLEIIKKQS
jgi:DNA-binding MarR family transcriptional regulator